MKLRLLLILLISAAVILAGAFLPQLAGYWLDSRENGLVNYAQITNVQLSFVDSGGQLNMRQKLPLLARYDSSMEVPESLAEQTAKQIRITAEEVVNQYKNAGLLSDSLRVTYDWAPCQAFLVYWDDAQTWSSIFWNVSLEFDPSRSLELIIDDQTGTVCSLAYHDRSEDYGWYHSASIDTAQSMDAALTSLCSLYLQGLGEEFSQYDAGALAAAAYTDIYPYADGQSRSVQFSWGDLIFGETTVNLLIHPGGFRVNVS